MARPLRIEFGGALYHITSRGNERRSIFRSDHDRRTFLAFLGHAAKRFGWSVTAFVLMTNHFHLVLQTAEPNLSRGMQWLNGTYAGWFNHRHKRVGHLFQGRFHALLVEKESYFAKLLRYVVLNPVRAKMVERPEECKWSSYRATAGLEGAPEWLDVPAALAWLGADPADAQTGYRRYVLAAIGCEDRLWDKVINAIYLGSERWTKEMRKVVESRPRSTDHPVTQRAVGRPRMHVIVKTVTDVAKRRQESISSAERRRLMAWIGWHEGLITLRSIAAGLRLRSEGYVSSLIRRCDQEFATNGRCWHNSTRRWRFSAPEERATQQQQISIVVSRWRRSWPYPRPCAATRRLVRTQHLLIESHEINLFGGCGEPNQPPERPLPALSSKERC